MNTTNVFVELLVIGLGPVTALVLVALLVPGPSTLPIADVIAAGSSLAFLVPMLAATYVPGIVVDRLADRVFGLSASGWIRRASFPTDQAYHAPRTRRITIRAARSWSTRRRSTGFASTAAAACGSAAAGP